MKLNITWNCEVKKYKDLFKKNKDDLLKILNLVVDELNSQFKVVTVSLNLFDAQKIRWYNNEYREIDKTTDVLSFPQNELFEDEYDLGDILINGDMLEIQAKEIESDIDTELKFLFMHGLLHLIGYDHQTKADEIKMIKKQQEIFRKTKIRND